MEYTRSVTHCLYVHTQKVQSYVDIALFWQTIISLELCSESTTICTHQPKTHKLPYVTVYKSYSLRVREKESPNKWTTIDTFWRYRAKRKWEKEREGKVKWERLSLGGDLISATTRFIACTLFRTHTVWLLSMQFEKYYTYTPPIPYCLLREPDKLQILDHLIYSHQYIKCELQWNRSAGQVVVYAACEPRNFCSTKFKWI